MSVNVRALPITGIVVAAASYVVCAAFVALAPDAATTIGSYIVHMDLSKVGRTVTWRGGFIGLITAELHGWMLIRLLISVLLGALVGYERERQGKPAGLRTHAMVGLGATLFTVVSLYGFGPGTDTSRVAAMIVSGIGFLGAGAILHERGGVQGLTTAASLWVTAAIGIAVGAMRPKIGTNVRGTGW